MSQDITPREALIRLGASTAEAVAQVLEMFAPGGVQRGEVTVIADGTSPFASVARGSIASSVSYTDGVTGANIFVLTPTGARSLAGAMGAPAPDEPGPELSDLEMSAIDEAANQTMGAAAAAIGVVLGQAIEISTPDTRVLDDPASAADVYGTAPHAISTTFVIAGESCRLIQLVPAAFVVRVARAIDDRSAEQNGAGASIGGSTAGDDTPGADASPTTMALEEALGAISLRVWAELGRAHLPLGSALGLPVGAVLDLDRSAEAPVDLYVNGVRFARGQLLVTDDGEWAVSLEALESEGLRLLDQARAAQPEARADVEAESESFDLPPDHPIQGETSSPEPEETSPPESETPDVLQSAVEGAVK